MNRPASYNTKQSQAILAYIASLGGGHVTVGQIAEHFGNAGAPVGLTTIYRHLDKLVRRGKVHRYVVDGVAGSCYQYAGDDGVHAHEDGAEHFHLKCERCGTLLHLRCGTLEGLPRHVYEEHAFQIDTKKTVFYGKCAACLDESAERDR